MQSTEERNNLSPDLELDLQMIFMAIWRRIGLCVFIVGTAILIALAYVFCVTPTYLASCQILAQPGQLQVSRIQSVEQKQGSDTKSFLSTQVAILSSTPLMQTIFDEFFKDDKRFAEVIDPIEDLKKSFRIKQVPKTDLIDVGFEDESAERAAKVANRLGQLFIDSNMVRTSQLTKDAFGQMELEVVKKAEEVDVQRLAIENFNKANNVYSVDGSRAQAEQRLKRISAEIVSIEDRIHRLNEVSFFLEQWKDKGYELVRLPDLSAVRGETKQTLSKLKKELGSALDALESLKIRSNENHRNVRNLRERIKEIKIEARKQAVEIGHAVEVELAETQSFLSVLQEKRKTLEAECTRLNKLAFEYRILKTKLSAAEANYTSVLRRLAELKIAYATNNTTNGIFQIIAPANVPEKRHFPKRAKILVITTLGAGFLSVLLCIVLELLNTSVRSVAGLRKFPQTRVYEADVGGMRADVVMRLVHDVASPATILFTSARESSGSALVVAELCEKMARLGKRVLMIDADLQNRNLSRKYNYKEKPDLLDLLRAGKGKASCVHLAQADVSFLGLTKAFSEEDEWNIKNMATVVQTLGSGYDYVVVYAPALLCCSQSRMVAMQLTLNEGLLFVKQRETRQADVEDALGFMIGGKVSFLYQSEESPKTLQDCLRRIL